GQESAPADVLPRPRGRVAPAIPAPVTLYPARRAARPMTAETLWAIPRVGRPVPAPDGTRFAVAVATPDVEANELRSRIWLVPADGGEPRPITAAEHSSGEPALSPDGSRL